MARWGIGRFRGICERDVPHRYAGSIELIDIEMDSSSPGIQEYIEGASFLHYLRYGVLITLAEVRNTMRDADGREVSHARNIGSA